MRFWEIAGAQHAAFCSTKRASEDGRGRSAARRFLRDAGVDHASIMVRSRTVTAVLCAVLPTWSSQFLKSVSHESFFFRSSNFTLWEKSRTRASLSHLHDGSLARKLRFRIFSFHFWREVSHESFVFTSSAFSFPWKARMKASFSHLQFFHFWAEVSHESFVFTSSTFISLALDKLNQVDTELWFNFFGLI